MLQLKPAVRIRFLLLVIVALLIAISSLGDTNAKQRTEIENQNKQNIELKTRLEKQDKRIKQIENDFKKLKKSVTSSQTPTIKQAVNYPIGCEQYRYLFERYDWDVKIAMAISASESSCDPNAISPTNDYGLMQLNNVPILDPAKNIEYAYYHKYLTPQKWGHWTDFNNGKYLKYL